MTNWTLAVTAPHAENAVSAELARRSIEHIVFMERRARVVRGRFLSYVKPAFPGYVFIPYDHVCDALAIERVTYVVPKDRPPCLISPAVVDELITRCGGSTVFDLSENRSRFQNGDLVEVSGYGPVAGHVGIFQRMLEHGRACVLFDWMGQFCPVEVDECDLENKTKRSKNRRRRKRDRRRRSLSAPAQ